MIKLTKEDILHFIQLREKGMNNKQISEYMTQNGKSVKEITIANWFRKLKKKGYSVPEIKKGRPQIL